MARLSGCFPAERFTSPSSGCRKILQSKPPRHPFRNVPTAAVSAQLIAGVGFPGFDLTPKWVSARFTPRIVVMPEVAGKCLESQTFRFLACFLRGVATPLIALRSRPNVEVWSYRGDRDHGVPVWRSSASSGQLPRHYDDRYQWVECTWVVPADGLRLIGQLCGGRRQDFWPIRHYWFDKGCG